MRNSVKFLNQAEIKTSQFEIVFKLLARFGTQFIVKESFKLLFASYEENMLNHATVWQQRKLWILVVRAGDYGSLN